MVLFTVRYHEKWADEAQAWLIARDLDLKTCGFTSCAMKVARSMAHHSVGGAALVFSPVRTLWVHRRAFAIAGVAVLVFKAPFPWYVRWPLAFTYVMVYQYAVIARPYTLLPLLCFRVALSLRTGASLGDDVVVVVLLIAADRARHYPGRLLRPSLLA